MKLTPIGSPNVSHLLTSVAVTKYWPFIIDDPKSISQSHELSSNWIWITAKLSYTGGSPHGALFIYWILDK